ncbi:MAG: S8 family serine peptidase [Bdellovibrionales bacterium]|nr:S8 family serine peptidase [Bdellovibrionales bacterium]
MKGATKIHPIHLSTLHAGAIGLGLLLASCNATRLQDHKQIRHSAPGSANEVGTIVKGVDESQVVDLLNEQPQARARVINKNHGIFEIFTVEKEALESKWPKSKLSRNSFFHIFEPDPNALSLKQRIHLLNNTSNTDIAPQEKIRPCEASLEEPTARINVIETSEELSDQVMNLGGSFTLTAEKSTPHALHISTLRTGWLVTTPASSKIGQQAIFGNSLNYKPDAYGAYNFLMVVQDDRNVCAVTNFELVVTGNQAYVGRGLPVEDLLSKVDRGQFLHLLDLRAEEAQAESVAQGEGIVIAVIDTGVNYNHPALLKNIWTNEREIPGNGIDDDSNGQTDDLVGYDFVNGDEWPFDDHGHGSHVSGLAASSLFGVAPRAQIMSLKALGPQGGDVASLVGAIYYAVDNGARILNMSLGTYGSPDALLVGAMDYAKAKDVVVVAAAGNGHPLLGTGVDTDQMANYPSALPHDNIIAVAAKDSNPAHVLAPYSNYGINSVDVAAPGGNSPENLLTSCYLDNPLGILFMGMVGTSMAAPNVSGVIALMLSLNPYLNSAQVKEILLTTGQQSSDLAKLIRSGRYMDAFEAVQASKWSLPGKVTQAK